ncbi:hypothetical protein OAM69_04995 [bacterium]|nr:hypothetical protein [bacterium]
MSNLNESQWTMSSDTPFKEKAADTIRSTSSQTVDTVRDEAVKLGSTARQASESIARERAEEVRGHVAARTGSVETAVSDIASTLGEHSDTLGHHASEFADTLSTFNDRLKTSSLDELASDARRVARNNPAMFMLGAVTIGAIAARFFQASEPRTGTRITADQAADIQWGSDHE